MSSQNFQQDQSQSKRHKSVLTPSLEDIEILRLEELNNISLNKIKLRSNSLFAFQEFDKFTSLFENHNLENISSYNTSLSNSSYEEENFQNSKNKKVQNIFYPNNNIVGFNIFNENNNLKNNNINNNYSNNNYLFNNGYPDNINFRRNSLGLLNNFLYYNYSFQMPYQQTIINNNINNNNNTNNQFNNSININSFKRNSYSFQQPYIYSQEYYQIFNKLQDQVGCRQLQEKLEEKKNDINFIQQFYKYIENNLTNVINHQFGNYVVQKLFDIFLAKNNKKMITNFFSQIKNSLIIISLHNYGTRVFQKILEKLERGKYLDIETDELNNIFKKLIENHIVDLCSDINGNHVFQKIVKIYPLDKNNFIFDKLSENCVLISKLKQGVSIFENCFLIATNKQRDKVVHSIIREISNLINDEYGNYTIQLIVNFKNDEYNKIIFDYFKINLVSLSNKKFSSNVIDRAIIKNCKNSISLIEYMVKNNLIKYLIVDQYGNYVVQKALNITKGEPIFIEIINQIKLVIEKLKLTSIGKRIYEHLNNKYESFFNEL